MNLYRFAIYVFSFGLGFALMGLEMLASRYLNPYFGGGITTWSALISTVLTALMLGYLLGGQLADRWPRPALCGILAILSSAFIMLIAPMTYSIFPFVIQVLGDGAGGAFVAAAILLLLPLMLISTFSPFGIRLILRDTAHGGRVSGGIYGVSTIGNILGTSVTTFVLMPIAGTKVLTFAFALIIGATGLAMIALDYRRED